MTSTYDRNEEEDDEEDEVGSRTGAEDNLSNSDGPLLLVKKNRRGDVDVLYGRYGSFFFFYSGL